MTHTLIELEVVRYTHPTLVHPLSNVVFALFCLIALNRAVKAFAPRIAFSAGELLTVYMMLGVVSTLCTHDLLEILISLIPIASPRRKTSGGSSFCPTCRNR